MPVYESQKRFRECGVICEKGNECYKRFYSQCLKKREFENRCYTSFHSEKVPRNERVLNDFY